MEAGLRPDASIQNLLRLLAAESRVIDGLLKQAHAKRDAILAREQAAIAAATMEEARLLAEVRRLEEERTQWVHAWLNAREAGEAPGGGASEPVPMGSQPSKAERVSLAQIVDSLPEAEGRKVRELADTLQEQLDALDDANRQNAGLLYHALAYVQTVLGTLTDVGDGGLYGPAAPGPAAGGRSLVDRRV